MFGRADAAQVGAVIEGLRQVHGEDDELLEHGIALFEALYRAHSVPPSTRTTKTRAAPSPRRRIRRRTWLKNGATGITKTNDTLHLHGRDDRSDEGRMLTEDAHSADTASARRTCSAASRSSARTGSRSPSASESRCRTCPPPSASGISASPAAIAVIRIGTSRSRAPRSTASRKSRDALRPPSDAGCATRA